MPADHHPAPRDEGSAMILVLMVLVLLTALGATLSAVTLGNLQSSRRADEASRVVNAAEAGVAQAFTFIRQNGVGALDCRLSGASWLDCGDAYGRGNPVGSPAGVPNRIRYSAWVEQIEQFTPNSDTPGVYRIHSVGSIGTSAHASCDGVGGACRSVTADVVVSDFGLGSGIYSKEIQGNSAGNSTVVDQSVFTTGCFPKRGSLHVSGFDAAHGIPAGVHSSGIITDRPASKCSETSDSIHAGGSDSACDSAFPFDQDSQGGPLSVSGSCAAAVTASSEIYGSENGAADGVFGSKIVDQAAMQETFGLTYPALSDQQVERLKEIAEEDQTYSIDTSWPSDEIAQASRGVFFFDLTDGHQTEVSLGSIPPSFATEAAACSGAVVIIQNGNAKITSNTSVVGASVFLLSSGGRGVATLNGGTLYGGLFAQAIDFGGNVVLKPADCTDGSANPALLTVTMKSYSEDD